MFFFNVFFFLKFYYKENTVIVTVSKEYLKGLTLRKSYLKAVLRTTGAEVACKILQAEHIISAVYYKEGNWIKELNESYMAVMYVSAFQSTSSQSRCSRSVTRISFKFSELEANF